MGTHTDASVTAVLGAPAHAPAEHGCAPSHKTVSWGCLHTPQPSLLWEQEDVQQEDEAGSWE